MIELEALLLTIKEIVLQKIFNKRFNRRLNNGESLQV
jgi:hypothetical protein